MSINHYSLDLPETTLWWTQQQQQAILMEPIHNPSTSGPPIHPSFLPQLNHHHQPSSFNSHTPRVPPSSFAHYPTTTPRFNLNNQDEDEEEDDDNNNNNNNNNEQQHLNDDHATTTTTSQEGEDEKEPMFEKPLTPSDVGKLNRLVIPKQNAEKYFPLGAGGDSVEGKGLLLSFEDESGKCWRFRYSYWNSSQSYVLTKGWSRYVKDKRLDAGDVVLFQRHRADAQRLFIGWRRRQPSGSAAAAAHVSRAGHGNSSDGNCYSMNGVGGGGGGGSSVGVGWTRGFYSAHPYPTHQSLPYQHDCLHAGREPQGQNQRTRPEGNNSSSSSRVLRLFGVNMECQPEHDSGPYGPECSYHMSPTQGTDTNHFYHHHQPSSYSSSPHHRGGRQQPYYY